LLPPWLTYSATVICLLRGKSYNGSRVVCARVASEEDIHLLGILTKVNMIRPLKNRVDLLTFYTAIKEDMDFLVTENIDDFEKPLKLFKMEKGTKLQLRNITDFEKLLKSTTTVKQVKHQYPVG
jgi:hypothetical protein